jgi:hypothetical protein
MEKKLFKIGDTVKIVSQTKILHHANKIGDIGVIVKFESNNEHARVQVEGREDAGNWAHVDDLELQKPFYKFAVHDIVVINEKGHQKYGEGSGNPKGLNGVVTELIDDEGFKYRVKFSNGAENTYEEDTLDLIEIAQKKDATQELTVDKQFVLDAYKAACSEWKAKIEKKFPELFEKTYAIGDRFVLDEDCISGDYVLAQVLPREVCLINLEDGNRLNNPVTVYNPGQITTSEYRKIAYRKDGEIYPFKKILKISVC